MASIDKSKFQFVKRDDFASETMMHRLTHTGNQ